MCTQLSSPDAWIWARLHPIDFEGSTCSATMPQLVCDFDSSGGATLTLPLASGDDVLVVASAFDDDDDADGVYDISATYQIDIEDR